MNTGVWYGETRFDWLAYVTEKGGFLVNKRRKDEYMLECPECGKEKLAVNVYRKKWRCFTCEDGGVDAISLVQKAEQIDYYRAVQFLLHSHAQPIGRIDRVELKFDQSQSELRSTLFNSIVWPIGFNLVNYLTPIGRQGVEYCRQRGISDLVAREMRLGVTASGTFKNRLIFPVFDRGNRLIFYQGRAMWSGEKQQFGRYIKTLSVRTEQGCAGAGDVLLNLQYLIDHNFKGRVAIVEGPIDCAHAWPDAVATFGKKISDEQIALLVRAGIQGVDLCWDYDALEAMKKAAPRLADFFDVRIVQLPVGKDPGDLSKDALEYYRSKALVWGSGDRLLRVAHRLKF